MSTEEAGGAEPGRRGWGRLLLRTFGDPEVESLYREFHDTARRADVQYMLACALACSALSLGHEVPSGYRVAHLATVGALTALHALLLAASALRWPGATGWRLLPFTAWALFVVTVCAHVRLGHLAGPTDALEWYLLLILLVCMCLPVRLRWCLLMSTLTVAVYLGSTVAFAVDRAHLRERVSSGCVLLLGATALGATAYLFTDLRQRRTYLETRKVIEVKTSIEDQSRTRERLLLSVLPRHVAETMRQDWGRMDVGQFKKIYMKRHEDVSILFADIVGFTAISSTYSAYDLVHMLNELFASFDRLADKYKQLRIKILGDCYYCISGCPEGRADHAVQSVYMGLSMVTAIQSVRESTRSTVDMRVGIHTGAVLAGVMGQKQWQFDVYSKDVELANKMESSGKPGRVHVSNKTLEKLGDTFEVEPAFAEKREPFLRRAGLTTYFIVRPMVMPVSTPSRRRQENVSEKRTEAGGHDPEMADNHVGSHFMGQTETLPHGAQGNNQEEILPPNGEAGKPNCSNKLRSDIISRQIIRQLRPHVRWFSLCFTDVSVEREYRANREPTFGLSVICLPIVLCFNAISQGIITPSSAHTVGTLFTGLILLLIMSLFMLPLHWMKRMPRWLSTMGSVMQASNTRTICWVVSMNIVLTLCNLIDMVLCPLSDKVVSRAVLESADRNSSTSISSSSSSSGGSSMIVCSAPPPAALQPHTCCVYPAYFTYFGVLILCTYPVQVELRHLVKLPLLLATVGLHIWVNIAWLGDLLDCAGSTIYRYQGLMPEKYELCLVLAVTCVVVIVLDVHTELTSRAAFLWKREMAQQQREAASLQEKNESLVQNLLPQHVTQHFLKVDVTTSQHEELYAQSFDEVGVLFASMPNFADFYTEETVNNQGLECLRFLNEVISDYDALLDSQRFRGISKIKTIASSYMAASGLVSSYDLKGEPDLVKWHHLSVLVEFAMQLRTTLNNINAESFNHFILQMGINHGPVTAGVIGARKPHYDIWGNTVNVASRMESTGQAGQIQVTGETKAILELFGYTFEQRGIILIKGKGQLLTYFLTGCSGQSAVSAGQTAGADSQSEDGAVSEVTD